MVRIFLFRGSGGTKKGCYSTFSEEECEYEEIITMLQSGTSQMLCKLLDDQISFQFQEAQKVRSADAAKLQDIADYDQWKAILQMLKENRIKNVFCEVSSLAEFAVLDDFDVSRIGLFLLPIDEQKLCQSEPFAHLFLPRLVYDPLGKTPPHLFFQDGKTLRLYPQRVNDRFCLDWFCAWFCEERTKGRTIEEICKVLSEQEAQFFQPFESSFSAIQRKKQTQLLIRHLNPHFIFNTLNAMKYHIILNHPDAAADLINDFSKYLRSILYAMTHDELVLFQKEWETAKSYLNIQKIRFEQLRIETDLETQDFYLPSSVLLPLIENAVRHGLCPKGENGKLKITVKQNKETIHITIEDNGIEKKKKKENISTNRKWQYLRSHFY